MPADVVGASRRLVFPLVAAVVVLESMFFAALTPMLPYYAARFGLSESATGVLSGAYAAGTLLGAVPSGRLGTKFGSRRLLVASLVVISLTSLAFAFGDNIVVLDAARFVLGLAGAGAWVGAIGWLLSMTFVGERGRTIGAVTALGFAGGLLGPVFGAAALAVGPQAPFCTVAALGALLIVLTLLAPRSGATDAGNTASDGPPRRAWTDMGIAVGMLLIVLPSFTAGAINLLNPLRLDRLGATGLVIGVTFLVAAALQSVGQVLVGRLSDVVGRRRPLVVLLGTGVLLLAVLPLVETVWLCAALVVAATVAYGMMYTPATALLIDATDACRIERSRGLSFVLLAWAGGQWIGALAAGGVADVASDTIAYLTIVALGVVFLSILVIRSSRLRRIGRGLP